MKGERSVLAWKKVEKPCKSSWCPSHKFRTSQWVFKTYVCYTCTIIIVNITKWCKCTCKGKTYLPFALHVYSWVPKCHLPELFWVFGLFENYQISFQQSRKKNIHVDIFLFSVRERKMGTQKWQGWKSCAPWHTHRFIVRGLQLEYLFFVVFLGWRRKDAHYFK